MMRGQKGNSPLPSDWVGDVWRARIERYWHRLPRQVLLFAALAVVSAGWASDALKGETLFVGWWGGAERWKLVTMAASLVLFAAATVALYVRRQELLGVHALYENPARARSAIVFTISPPGKLTVRVEDGVAVEVAGAGRNISVTGNLETDISALAGSNWPWQQILRGLHPHVDTVSWVYLIGSAETRPHLESVRALVQAYLPHVPAHQIRCHERPAPFDEVRLMMNEYDDAIRFLNSQGVNEPRITIDVTGGLKTTSVAGAMMTVSKSVVFQYVHTTDARVIECDMVHTMGKTD